MKGLYDDIGGNNEDRLICLKYFAVTCDALPAFGINTTFIFLQNWGIHFIFKHPANQISLSAMVRYSQWCAVVVPEIFHPVPMT